MATSTQGQQQGKGTRRTEVPQQQLFITKNFSFLFS